jgi:hypothetical protein
MVDRPARLSRKRSGSRRADIVASAGNGKRRAPNARISSLCSSSCSSSKMSRPTMRIFLTRIESGPFKLPRRGRIRCGFAAPCSSVHRLIANVANGDWDFRLLAPSGFDASSGQPWSDSRRCRSWLPVLVPAWVGHIFDAKRLSYLENHLCDHLVS